MRIFSTAIIQRYVLVCTAVFCLLPYVVQAFYSHPALDDFAFAMAARQMGWLSFQQHIYLTWQGAYTTNALMSSLNPLVSGRLEYYWMSPLLVLAGLVLGARQLCRALLPADCRNSGMAVLLVLFLVQLPNPAEGLYWLNAAWAYLLGGTGLLWWGALAVDVGQRPTAWRVALLATLTAVLIGTNPVTGGILTSTLLATAIGSAVRTRSSWIILSGVAVLCLGISLASPGNGIRLQTVEAAGASPLTVLSLLGALGRALVAATYTGLNWLGNGLLVATTLLLTPTMAHLATHQSSPLNQLTRHPIWLTIVVAGLFLAAFFPTYWAIQLPPPPRLRNVIYLLFVVGWLLTAYAWVAWWIRSGWPWPVLPTYVRVALLCWLPLAALTDHNTHLTHLGIGQQHTTVVQAYRDWLSGDAACYDAVQKARYQQLRATRQDRVALPPLPVRPWTLFYYDISFNPGLWGNQAYAQFFGKKAVWVQPPQEASR